MGLPSLTGNRRQVRNARARADKGSVMPGSAAHGDLSARSAVTLCDEVCACGATVGATAVLIDMAQAPSRRQLI
jgi:hypothetical protein